MGIENPIQKAVIAVPSASRLISLSKGTNKCNCSICTKSRAWFVLVKPEPFRLLAGS